MAHKTIMRMPPTVYENDYVYHRPGWCGFLLFPRSLDTDPTSATPQDAGETCSKHWHIRVRTRKVGNEVKAGLCTWGNARGYRKFTVPSGQRLSHIRSEPATSPCTVCHNITIDKDVPVWKCDHCSFKFCGDCLIEEAVLCSPVTPDRIHVTLSARELTATLVWPGSGQIGYNIRCPKCHYSNWREKTEIGSLPTELLLRIIDYAAFGGANADTIQLKRCLTPNRHKSSWSSVRLVNRLFYDLFIDLWKRRLFTIHSSFWFELFHIDTPAFRAIKRVSWMQDIHLFSTRFRGRVGLGLIFANAPIKHFLNCLETVNLIDIELRFWSFEEDTNDSSEVYVLLSSLQFFESQLACEGDATMSKMYNHAKLSHSVEKAGSALVLKIRWQTPFE